MLARLVFGLLFLLGLAMVVFNQAISKKYDELFGEKDLRAPVAKVVSVNGDGARYRLPRALRFNEVTKGLPLKDQDTLMTDGETSTVVTFNSGFEVEVAPNSLLVVEEPKEDDQGRFQVTFLKGDFKVLKKGQGNVVVKKRSTARRVVAPKPVTVAAIPEALPPPPPPPKEDVMESVKVEELNTKPVTPKPRPVEKKDKEGLPDAYVADMIRRQKMFFNRCYAQHLRSNPEARGRMSFAFTIEPNGKVSSISVTETTINDPMLEQCSMAVIGRVNFRSFDGDPIVVNYPINFE